MPTINATNELLPELIAELLPALIQVESGGDDSAVGDGGKAVGCLQIHEIYVDDVNRIVHTSGFTDNDELFSYRDRDSRALSVKMIKFYLYHYGTMNRIKPTSKRDWLLKLARIHHLGPQGYLSKDTEYMRKIEKELNE